MIFEKKYYNFQNYFVSFFKLIFYFFWELIYQILLFQDTRSITIPLYPAWVSEEAKDKCNDCGLCSDFCPVDAIKIVKKKNTVDYFEIKLNACYGCEICLDVCPDKLLSLQKKTLSNDVKVIHI